MARRKKKDAGAGSLDSLLDTMTNVVGILVILLTVTQLGVRDAVERIGESEQVDPQVLEEAVAKADQLKADRQDMEERLAALNVNPEQQQTRLAETRKMLAAQQAKVDQMSALLSSAKAAKLAADKEAEAASKKQIEEHLAKMKELQEKFNTNATSIQSVRAQLAETPDPVAQPPKIVNIPNPRPAPEGAEPLTFLCRDGKLYFVDVAKHQERAQKWTAAEIARRNLGKDPKVGIDCDPLFASFNRLNFRDKWMEVTLTRNGRFPFLVFTRRESAGETETEIQLPTSDYQRGLAELDPDKYYLQFLVWNDSFELYLQARELAAQQNLLAGWQPMTTTEEYKVRLAGNLRHGPPPPPPKDPPPKKDPPKATKPPNVID